MKHYLRSLLLILTAALLTAGPAAAQTTQDKVNGTYKVDTIQYKGPSDQKIDLVFLGDGYTAEQMPTFVDDVKNYADRFFGVDPFSHYRDFFNIYLIETPSKQSGASIGTDKYDTFYGASFPGYSAEQRLISVNTTIADKVTAKNTPWVDKIIMIVNSTKYGGGGGFLCVFSKDYSAFQIFIHEFGHAFGGLADEYNYDSSPVEAHNLTRESDRAKIRWKNWLGTDDIDQYYWGNRNGVDWYKPARNCLMNTLDYPYCAVCREGLIEKIHEGSRFLTDYEPKRSAVSFTESQRFTISVPHKPSPNTLRITWTLDGQPLTRDVEEYTLSADKLTDGTHTLIATVEDTTTLIRIDNHSQLHAQHAQWTLTKRGGTVSYAPEDVMAYQKATEIKEGVRYAMAATDATGKHLVAQPVTGGTTWGIMKGKEAYSDDAGATLELMGTEDVDFTFTPSAGQYQMRQHADGRYVYSGFVRDNELMFTDNLNSTGSYDSKTFSITRQSDGTFDIHAMGTLLNRIVTYNASLGGFGTENGSTGTLTGIRPTLYERITTIPTIATKEGYSTYYGADPFIMPDGLEGTTITLDESGEGLKMAWEYSAGKIVPAHTPLLLRGTPGMSYTGLVVDNKDNAPTDNLLYGTLTDEQPTEDGKYYLLTYSNENGRQVLGFFWSKPDGAPFINRGGKAYLRLPLSVSAAALKGFSLDGPVTSLTDATTSTRTDAPVYDLSGRRISTTGTLPAGIYIIDGKKVVK